MLDVLSEQGDVRKTPTSVELERTILVVNEVDSARECLAAQLAEAGYSVMTAANGQEALVLSETSRFDVIVCDMHMLQMDGIIFRREVLKSSRNAKTPFLAMSSNDFVDTLRSMRGFHAAAFLTKPFQPQQLIILVERLLAETALHKSEECFRTVAGYTFAWEYWIGPDRRLLWMSPSCERITGYSVKDFMDDPDLPLKIVMPQDRWLMEHHLQVQLQTCDAHALDFRITTRDGRVRWLSHMCQAVYDSQGELAGRRASNVDVTERKLAEMALKRSEGHLRSILENSPMAMFLKDPQGNILVANERYAELCGLTVPEVAGQLSYGLVPDEAVKQARASDREVLRTGAPVEVESELKTPEGTRYLRWVKFPALDEDGRIGAIGGIASDITGMKKSEEFRQDVERILRHDLKSPLNAIMTLAPLIQEEGRLTASQQEMMTHIERYGERMLNMVDSSLRLFKIEQGILQLDTQSMDLAAMVAKVADELSNLLTARNKRLRLFIRGRLAEAGDTFIVEGDELLIFSLLTNLIKNALEAAPPETAVIVSLDENDAHFLRIHNQGLVPLEVRGRFFEKYATAGKPFGTGLGAYSAKLIAQAHGGNIYMVTAEDVGTTVTVVLPKQ